MKFIFAAIYAVTALVVSGQNAGPVYITSPLTGTVYTAGKPAVMNWINPATDVITKIVLAKGISTNIQPLITIAENVDTKLGTYSWNVPADTLPGDNYAFVLGVSPNVSYTGQFTIKNDNVALVASSGTSSATSSGAASSAASSAAVTPAAASSAASHSAASSSATASSGITSIAVAHSSASNSAHVSASTTPVASKSTSAGNSNKVAFGVVAAAGVAVMALI